MVNVLKFAITFHFLLSKKLCPPNQRCGGGGAGHIGFGADLIGVSVRSKKIPDLCTLIYFNQFGALSSIPLDGF